MKLNFIFRAISQLINQLSLIQQPLEQNSERLNTKGTEKNSLSTLNNYFQSLKSVSRSKTHIFVKLFFKEF